MTTTTNYTELAFIAKIESTVLFFSKGEKFLVNACADSLHSTIFYSSVDGFTISAKEMAKIIKRYLKKGFFRADARENVVELLAFLEAEMKAEKKESAKAAKERVRACKNALSGMYEAAKAEDMSLSGAIRKFIKGFDAMKAANSDDFKALCIRLSVESYTDMQALVTIDLILDAWGYRVDETGKKIAVDAKGNDKVKWSIANIRTALGYYVANKCKGQKA